MHSIAGMQQFNVLDDYTLLTWFKDLVHNGRIHRIFKQQGIMTDKNLLYYDDTPSSIDFDNISSVMIVDQCPTDTKTWQIQLRTPSTSTNSLSWLYPMTRIRPKPYLLCRHGHSCSNEARKKIWPIYIMVSLKSRRTLEHNIGLSKQQGLRQASLNWRDEIAAFNESPSAESW